MFAEALLDARGIRVQTPLFSDLASRIQAAELANAVADIETDGFVGAALAAL